jgi:hypothetical protein
MHCLKYQGIIAPDGLLIHFFRPIEGRYHDRTAWVDSGIEEKLGIRRSWEPTPGLWGPSIWIIRTSTLTFRK